MDSIKEIIRLSVTLEDFSSIQANLKDIVDDGVFGEDVSMAVSMSIADLQSVFDILENPIEKMFYLQRRRELQETAHYRGDELDLLGLYIDTGFELGDVETGRKKLIVTGMSQGIDEYFQARDQGIERDRPRRKFTKWFHDVREQLGNRKPKRWTEAAVMLLNLTFEDQRKIESHFNLIRRSLLKSSTRRSDDQNTTVVSPPEWRRTGFACVAFFKEEQNERHAIMENASLNLFRMSQAERCLVIARDVEGDAYPYATLAVYDRPSEID